MQDQLAFSGADEAPGPRAELSGSAVTVRFLLAGNAYVTFESRRTGTRFTYRVVAGDKPGRHLVNVLVGPDNGASYVYLGCVYDGRAYSHSAKSKITKDAPSAVAFTWAWRALSGGKMPVDLAVYHEGRCGKCGRRLTTPESVSTGLGPKCGGRE